MSPNLYFIRCSVADALDECRREGRAYADLDGARGVSYRPEARAGLIAGRMPMPRPAGIAASPS